jgi:hypothetical protein
VIVGATDSRPSEPAADGVLTDPSATAAATDPTYCQLQQTHKTNKYELEQYRNAVNVERPPVLHVIVR